MKSGCRSLRFPAPDPPISIVPPLSDILNKAHLFPRRLHQRIPPSPEAPPRKVVSGPVLSGKSISFMLLMISPIRDTFLDYL